MAEATLCSKGLMSACASSHHAAHIYHMLQSDQSNQSRTLILEGLQADFLDCSACQNSPEISPEHHYPWFWQLCPE